MVQVNGVRNSISVDILLVSNFQVKVSHARNKREIWWGKTKDNYVHKLQLAWLRENPHCFPQAFLAQCLTDINQYQKVKITRGRPNIKPKISKIVFQNREFTFYKQGMTPCCCVFSLASALSFLGWQEQAEQLHSSALKILKAKNNFTATVKHVEKYGLFHEVKKIRVSQARGDDNFKAKRGHVPFIHPVCDFAHEENIVLVQLCAVSHKVSQKGSYDNTHAVVICQNLIFDANHNKPLELTEDNINSCLVGGKKHMYHHVSRAYKFVFKK